MAFATVRGARLAWQQMGQGPDLILLHGLAASRAFWFPMAAALSATHRVTLFDLRGHGYSERAATGYSSLELGRDLIGLMDALELPRASVVGHSFGGGAALEAALLAPERLDRLALLDTRVQRLQPKMRLRDLGELPEFERLVLARAGGAEAFEDETQIGFRFLEESARQTLAKAPGQGRDEFVPFGEGSGALRAASAFLRLLEETDARIALGEPGHAEKEISLLSLPVLLMVGERSRCGPSAQALARLIPRARLVTVPGAGHFFPISAAAFTLARLREFLDLPLEHAA